MISVMIFGMLKIIIKPAQGAVPVSAACLIVLFVLTAASPEARAVFQEKKHELCSPEHCFRVDIAGNAATRRAGLMHKVSMPESDGMLLVFDGLGYHKIWMKNVHFPLDLLWLDKDFKIVDVRLDVQPCLELKCPSYIPHSEALYVLEVVSGESQKAGFEIGKTLKSSVF